MNSYYKLIFMVLFLGLPNIPNAESPKPSNLPDCHGANYHNCFGKAHQDGKTYVGEFQNNKFNGQGVYTDSKGSKYVGSFENNKPHGNGIFSTIGGTTYKGQMKNGNFDGYGILYSPNGDRYEGEFVSGRKNGKGILFFQTGGREEGEFRNNVVYGTSIYYDINGRITKNVYREGQLVDQSRFNSTWFLVFLLPILPVLASFFVSFIFLTKSSRLKYLTTFAILIIFTEIFCVLLNIEMKKIEMPYVFLPNPNDALKFLGLVGIIQIIIAPIIFLGSKILGKRRQHVSLN